MWFFLNIIFHDRSFWYLLWASSVDSVKSARGDALIFMRVEITDLTEIFKEQLPLTPRWDLICHRLKRTLHPKIKLSHEKTLTDIRATRTCDWPVTDTNPNSADSTTSQKHFRHFIIIANDEMLQLLWTSASSKWKTQTFGWTIYRIFTI